MNFNKKTAIITASCAAVIVVSALAFRKVKAGITKIIEAKEPEDEPEDMRKMYVSSACQPKDEEPTDEMPTEEIACCEHARSMSRMTEAKCCGDCCESAG